MKPTRAQLEKALDLAVEAGCYGTCPWQEDEKCPVRDGWVCTDDDPRHNCAEVGYECCICERQEDPALMQECWKLLFLAEAKKTLGVTE